MVYLAIAAAAAGQISGKSSSDARVRKAMNDPNLKLQEDPERQLQARLLPEGRSDPPVVVESKTNEMGVFEIREMWAVGLDVKGAPVAGHAGEAADSADGQYELEGRRLGAVQAGRRRLPCDLQRQGGGGLRCEALKTVLNAAARTADEMENLLVGSDDL